MAALGAFLKSVAMSSLGLVAVRLVRAAGGQGPVPLRSAFFYPMGNLGALLFVGCVGFPFINATLNLVRI